MHEDTARDFLLAVDCALNASTQSDMQGSMDLCTKACDAFGLTISTKKTEVLHQLAPAAPCTEPHITVNGQRLAAVDKFVYLGGTLSLSVNIDEEVSYESKEPVLPLERTESWHQAKSLSSSSSTIPALCMRDLDSLQPTCQAAQNLPYEMSQDLAPCDVAWQSSSNRSAPAGQNGEHSRHPYYSRHVFFSDMPGIRC